MMEGGAEEGKGVIKGRGLEGGRGGWTEEHTISKMKNNGCKI